MTKGCEGKENLSLNSDVVNNNSVNDVPMWKTIKDFSLPDISVNVEGKGQDLEGRVNSKGECGNGGLRINAPGDAVLRHDAKNDLVEIEAASRHRASATIAVTLWQPHAARPCAQCRQGPRLLHGGASPLLHRDVANAPRI
ncbi:hypothetical protein JHK87_053114 [Glycine soja]|nr:hypothetical protein JHK87_053114 [Glycine soja]